jgi:glycerophosphoryl diester phosphodiesterase
MIKRTKGRVAVGFLIFIAIVSYLAVFLVKAPGIHAIGEDTILGAHRGNSIEYPENSLEAIKDAATNPRYEFIEFDLQYTKDNKIILFHDYSINRMAGKFGKISDLTYDEINELSDFHVPQYYEVMEIVGDKKLSIEIKPIFDTEKDRALVDFIIEDCKQRGILDKVLLSSISTELVKYISDTYPSIKTGMIYWVHPVTYIHSDEQVENFYNKMDEIGADYIMLHGVNLKNSKLIEKKPKSMILSYWYFTDEMYIVDDELW